MPAGRVSLAALMKLTALIASELALIGSDVRLLVHPIFLFGIVALNLVAIQGLILGRPLRAFHFTFLIVGVISSVMITVLIFTTGFALVLVSLIRKAEAIFGVARVKRFLNYVSVQEASLAVSPMIGALAVCLTNRPERTGGIGQETGANAIPAGRV
jgi:hypothetical protein